MRARAGWQALIAIPLPIKRRLGRTLPEGSLSKAGATPLEKS
jgi:hypothetical protein